MLYAQRLHYRGPRSQGLRARLKEDLAHSHTHRQTYLICIMHVCSTFLGVVFEITWLREFLKLGLEQNINKQLSQ